MIAGDREGCTGPHARNGIIYLVPSRQSESFAENMLAALRNAFGGHAVRR